MPEPADVYADQFQITSGPYGCALRFSLSPASPPAPGAPPQAETVAVVRMSLEHMKVLTFMLRRQPLQYEQGAGVEIQVPVQILNGLQIGLEDWQALWRR
jgi:hypothetical protein